MRTRAASADVDEKNVCITASETAQRRSFGEPKHH